jgi:hypothetical protein
MKRQVCFRLLQQTLRPLFRAKPFVAAGVLEAVKGFRRMKGYADMPMLVAALGARDRQLGLDVVQEEASDRIVVNRAAAEFQQQKGHPDSKRFRC